MTDLEQLLADLKAAQHGNNALDARLEMITPLPSYVKSRKLNSAGTKVINSYEGGTHGTHWPSDYSARVDDGLRLLKAVLPGYRAILYTEAIGGVPAAMVVRDDNGSADGRAETLPLALCIAIVEAKIGEAGR